MTSEYDRGVLSENREKNSDGIICHSFYTVSQCMSEEPFRPELYSEDSLSVEIVTEGEGVHFFDHKSIPCKVNDMYIVSPGVLHGYFLKDESKPLTVRRLTFRIEDWFKADVATPGARRYCYGVFKDDSSVSYAMLNSRMREKTDAILDAVEAELQDGEDEWKAVVRAYLIQLLCFVSRYVNNSIKMAPNRTKDYDTVSETVRIMEREFNDCNLSLDQIARRVFISPSHLSRIFKLYTGQLFSEYLREIRLGYAAKLLKETELTVERIVSECGFRNVPAFYRNFRDNFDMTPQIYRQVVRTACDKDSIIDMEENKIMVILSDISENLQKGKSKIVKELVQQAIDEGADPQKILSEGLLAGMSVVGEKFKNNEIYVPEVLIAAKAMNAGAQLLKPYLAASGVKAAGKVCIGTVQGDLHDIGKNLVKMMMEGKGLEVVDLGTDVTPEAFVKAAIEENCGIICCSALLTTTMPVMEEVVKAAVAAGIRDKVKIMIGGAPITQEFCDKIGADVYSVDAASAADAAVKIFQEA